MEIIQKTFKVNNQEYYKKHLEIINTLLPVTMSNTEIEILGAFMSLDKKVTDNGYFNPLARKLVLTTLGISAANLSNNIKSLIKKGFLSKHEISNIITMKDFLFPELNNQKYQIKLIKDDIT